MLHLPRFILYLMKGLKKGKVHHFFLKTGPDVSFLLNFFFFFFFSLDNSKIKTYADVLESRDGQV